MQDWIASLLGPYLYVPPIAVAAWLWRFRDRLRTRHLVWLVALTGLGIVGLMVSAFLAIPRLEMPGWLVLGGIYGHAALVAGCGPNVLFAFALLVFGHSTVESPPRGRYQSQPDDAVLATAAPAKARGRQRWAAVFLMIVLPALATGILYALYRDITRGFMRGVTTRSHSGGGGARLISLEHEPAMFFVQAGCLLLAAAVCLWFGYRAFVLVFGLDSQRAETRPRRDR